MAQALYRKYRSKSLSEIVGQEHITEVLSAAIATDKVSHAFLLTGPRGVGKTSIARILAHDINKLSYDDESTHLDIIEIDAASNRRIDDIRDLREKVHIAPTSAPFKVYIIDEVHMLTGESFNALLKTLEEPPEHVVFILATTEPHKLPATIISRTQRFHFKPISDKHMVKHLAYIAKQENIKVDEAALSLIARHSEGSFRDGISLLDQLGSLVGDKKITSQLIESTLGLAPQESIDELISAIDGHKSEQVIKLLNNLEEDGTSPGVLTSQILQSLRKKIVTNPSYIKLIDELIEVPKAYNPRLKLLAVLALAAGPTKSMAMSVPVSPEVTFREAAQEKPMTSSAYIEKEIPAKKEREKQPAELNSPGQNQTAPESIDWNKVLEYVKKHHLPLHGILRKAQTDYQNKELTIYFSYSLYRKKLEDTKYRTMLASSIQAIHQSCPVIQIAAGPQPPKSKLASEVAAIMGGGEEVNVSKD